MYTMNTSMQGAGLVEYVKWLNTDKVLCLASWALEVAMQLMPRG
ncbi:hypothetical protein SLEP1_g48343 [Rubroshorea leprosula]|uniref:Uncharacterized protein n=1 Tax=Rubroshorea leprosula TaxID=152421 RepID=A0AAV5LWC0_9ROSI|nr:hypothetical protein SLEP1_g48343 [Rubroshorea leprosula]